MSYPANNNILGWWQSMTSGLLMIVDGLSRVVTFGFYRPSFSTDYFLWLLGRGEDEKG